MKDSDLSATAARDAARIVWFKRYPAKQTLVAFLLALLATTAFSIDPAPVSSNAVLAIDPKATGTLYVCYEVLLSFAGHTDAVMLLALACLLTLPFRYVFFGRGDAWRPSVVLPSLFFAVCMVFGRSYDLTDWAEIVLGRQGTRYSAPGLAARVGCSWRLWPSIWLLSLPMVELPPHSVSEAHFGRVWRVAHAVLSVHPFCRAVSCAHDCLGAHAYRLAARPLYRRYEQNHQWFNYPNGTSDYLRLLNPNVLLNGHHPVVHHGHYRLVRAAGAFAIQQRQCGPCIIYTCAQFVITAACMAYSISSLRKLGVSLPVRGAILLFFAFMPMFSNYAALLTKDVLFADAFLVLLVQTVKLVACGLPRRDANAERAGEQAPVLFVRHDWLLLALGAMGSTFLRNGSLVFPLAACVIAAAFCAWDAHVARRAAKQTGVTPSYAMPRFRWVGVLAVLALCLASNMYFTKVFMPAHDITPGSKREILSIPFQQTARFVQKHDGLNSGVNPTVKEDGTIVEAPCDGLVTDEERAVIDRVLKYENLGRRYNPDKSDAVKNCFNEYASQEDIKAYFEVWAQMFKKDPECYISALINNYYGYFYPSARDAWVYSTARSAEIMARPIISSISTSIRSIAGLCAGATT